MLSIGAFARIGQVTHRMLRHWDLAGLLVPASVDPMTGYRSYDPAQLDRLHRIVALRQLGFGIDEIAQILVDGIDASTLAAMLRERREHVERERRIAVERLADVERRLHLIEQEQIMTTTEIVEKTIPATRLVAHHGTASEGGSMFDLVGGLFDAARADVERAGGSLAVAIAQYDFGADGMQVTAGYESPSGAVELPAVDTAMCTVHLGPVTTIQSTWQALHGVIVERGFEPSGPARESYVRAESDDQADWVTELQQPVRRAS